MIAIEAGYRWQLLYDRLGEAGYDARLSQPLNVKAIAQAKVKMDHFDSETLAYMLMDRVKRKVFFVGLRTRLKNRVHAELAKREI